MVHTPLLMNVKAYIKQLRPKNWMKNVFVFIPLVFALELTDRSKLFATSTAFMAFCLVSSAVYVFNDVVDVDKDRAHPVKCNRPIASGAIGIKSAVAMATLLVLCGLGLAFYIAVPAGVVVAAYITVNVAYTLVLKHRPIFDCFCIAAGFVLRVFIGGVAIIEGVSDWLFLTVVAMSLFMAFGKRRGEMLRIDTANQRAVLDRYDLAFLNSIMFCMAGLSVVFYSLWSMARGMYMIYTVPLIIFIVSKYLLLVCDEKSHGDPTVVIFSNRALLMACAIYAVLTVALLYAGGGA